MKKVVLLIGLVFFFVTCSNEDTTSTNNDTIVVKVVDTPKFDSFYNELVSSINAIEVQNDLISFENFGIKTLGSVALLNTENWIKQNYESMGYADIELQSFSALDKTSNNIIVTKKGTLYPDKFIIVDAHYDTINGPGANDNGSGTALLLALARSLSSIETDYSIKFIHFSGEERGLFGSEFYVENTVKPSNLDILLVLNVDQVGGVNGEINDTIVCEQSKAGAAAEAESAQVTAALAESIALYSSLKTKIDDAYSSDYIPFENNGNVITGLFEANRSPYGHKPEDLVENLDLAYLTEVVKGTLGAVLHFAKAQKPLP